MYIVNFYTILSYTHQGAYALFNRSENFKASKSSRKISVDCDKSKYVIQIKSHHTFWKIK